MKSRLSYWVVTTLITTLLVVESHAEKKPGLTIVFPNVNAPYDAIFRQINTGIEKEYQGTIEYLKLPKSFDSAKVAESISSSHIIALGKRGLSVANQIKDKRSVVVGSLPIRPGELSGVSLMSDPAPLFKSLKRLSPKTKKIIVVYSALSAWIIPQAEKEAIKRNLLFEPIPITDIESAVKTYSEIFNQKKLDNTAIWLTLDSIANNDKIITPTILEKSWKKKVVVFSSKPTHAKRGALFSALPDNEKLGAQLASLVASKKISNSDQTTVEPAAEIGLAVNLRTAKHLGFKYSRKKRASFALTFN